MYVPYVLVHITDPHCGEGVYNMIRDDWTDWCLSYSSFFPSTRAQCDNQGYLATRDLAADSTFGYFEARGISVPSHISLLPDIPIMAVDGVDPLPM